MEKWDRFSERIDSIFLEWPQYVETLNTMTEMVANADGKSLLDLGCGTGSLIELLARRFPDARITGVDPSRRMLDRSLERLEDRDNVELLEGHALSIPCRSEEFDYITSNLALHHVEPNDRYRCARELARVLKRGGSLVYADLFCGFDAPPGDPQRTRDIIERSMATALYCLEHDAYEMMMLIIRSLPAQLECEGEFETTPMVWLRALGEARFVDFDIVEVPPVEFGIKIIRARLG